MKVYTIILHIVLILSIVSVSIVTSRRSAYNRLSYSDRSARSYQGPDSEYSPYDAARFNKHRQGSNYQYRLSRAQQERDYAPERGAYYEGPNSRGNDPSIAVIVDPTQKKAVAVIENGPAGQATYELTGYHNSKDAATGSETEIQSGNQNQATNLGPSSATADRKRNSKIFDSEAEFHSNTADDAYAENEKLASPQKRKRSMELKKHKLNNPVKMNPDKGSVKQEFTENQVVGIPMKNNKAKAEQNCPPHLEEKAKEMKRNEKEADSGKENAAKNTDKREIGNAFSQLQINALTDSLAKVQDTGADMENLRHMLYDMGLVRNYRDMDKRDIKNNDEEESKKDAKLDSANENAQSDTQQTKREVEQQETEDEDMIKDNIVMKREDSQSSNEQVWADDQDEQLDKREAVAAEYADEDEEEEMVDEPIEKRENSKEMENQEEINSGENQNEMIDNYETELQQTNMERNKREPDKNLQSKMKNSKVTTLVDNELENEQKDFDKTEQKRFDKDENKMIQDAETAYQMTSESNNADNDKTLIKRENAKDAKEKRMNAGEKEDTKKDVESLIKEKIEMIKEKVKREIVEENAEKSRRAIRSAGERYYYKNVDPDFQRNTRSANDQYLDSEAPVRRTKRDLSSASADAKLESHDVKNYVLNRRELSNATVTPDNLTSKRNPDILPETDAKELDPNFASHNLKPYIRERREEHKVELQTQVTNKTVDIEQLLQNRIVNNSELLLEKNNTKLDRQSEATDLKENIRKRREARADKLPMAANNGPAELEANEKTSDEAQQNKMLRKKRTNGVPEKQMVYEPFQNEDIDVSDEEEEFADDARDGRLYIDKRQARNDEDFQYFEEPQKRETENAENMEEERDLTYLNAENHDAEGRRRRAFEDEQVADNAQFRTSKTHEYERKKRGNGGEPLEGNAKLTEDEEYSENLYFGPLSQSYEGELTRYKRVKRDKP